MPPFIDKDFIFVPFAVGQWINHYTKIAHRGYYIFGMRFMVVQRP